MKDGLFMKKYKYKTNRNNKKYIKILAIGVAIIFLLFIFCKTKDFDMKLDNAAALNVSYEVFEKLKTLSDKYEINFPELFTYYAAENNFFENKIQSDDKLEQNFLLNYDKIKSKYDYEEIKSYIEIINNVCNDIKSFPIEPKYVNEYIYGDSWGSARTYGGNRIHKGCDILDRENIRGRIPVISMTDGKVTNIGWNEQGGYRVGITSQNDIYYYYAHFDSYEKGIVEGKNVKCGDVLGYMGDTGYGKEEGTKGNFPVHLHIGICPNTNLSSDEFWINPYLFLRTVEKNMQQETKK